MKYILYPFTWVISLILFILMIIINTMILLLIGLASHVSGHYEISVELNKTIDKIAKKRGIK